MKEHIKNQFSDYVNSKYGLNGFSFESRDVSEAKRNVGYRYEGTTQDRNLTDSISMRVYDPLWMLCRQWQLGEFRGNDAGTAMSVKYTYGTADINCGNGPMEPFVEQINHDISPMVRVESALYLFDLLKDAMDDLDAQKILHQLREAYPFHSANFVQTPIDDSEICASTSEHNRKLTVFNRTFAKKAFDGFFAYIGMVFYQNFSRLFSVFGENYGSQAKQVERLYIKWFEEKYLPNGLTAEQLRTYEQQIYDKKISLNSEAFFKYIEARYEIHKKDELFKKLSLVYPTQGTSIGNSFDLEQGLEDDSFVKILSPFLQEKKPELLCLKKSKQSPHAEQEFSNLKEQGKGVEGLSLLIGGIHPLPALLARLQFRMERLTTYVNAYKGRESHVAFHLVNQVSTDYFNHLLSDITIQQQTELNNYFNYQINKNGLGRYESQIHEYLTRRYEIPGVISRNGLLLFDVMGLYTDITNIGLYAIFRSIGLCFSLEVVKRIENNFMSMMDYVIKDKQSNWRSNQLGYDYMVRASNQNFIAKDYSSGQLSWYNFDVEKTSEAAVLTDVKSKYAIPTLATFASAPNKRLWQFENRKVFLGNSTEMQSKGNIAMLQYTTMYGNDWMLFPLETEIGKLVQLQEIVVYDTFGQRTVISQKDLAGKKDLGVTTSGNRWQMYNNAYPNNDVSELADTGLFFPPSLINKQESEPVEEVQFVRDEMANMVWAVEKKTEDGCGGYVDLDDLNSQLSQQVDERNKKTISTKTTIGYGVKDEESGTANSEKVADRTTVVTDRNVEDTYKYYLQTHVPFNWIPLTVQHTSCDSAFSMGGRSNVFRRAKMPVFLDGFKPVHPVTSMMRKGIYQNVEFPLYINEEEVQQVGTMVTKNYQRTRWINGAVYNWIGYETQLKNMQVNSNLLFDALCREEKLKK